MATDQIQQDNPLTLFVDRLIEEGKDPAITQENKQQVKELLLNEVENEVNLHLVNLLSDEDRQQLDSLMDSTATNDQVDAFLQQRIPHMQEEMTVALTNFRSAYLRALGQTIDPTNMQQGTVDAASPLVPPPSQEKN